MYKIIFIFLFMLPAFSMNFEEAVKLLGEHSVVQSIDGRSQSVLSKARSNGSWGDPIFRLAAKNYPKESLKNNETPMTGLEIGLSQKISLTNKYSTLREATESLSQSESYAAIDSKRGLVKSLWNILILERRINEEKEILEESFLWLKKILKVSKKLYANGKITQQAILEIEIRKSEVAMKLNKTNHSLLKIKNAFNYLLGEKHSAIDKKTIPWKILTANSKRKDFKELSLQSKLKFMDLSLSAANKNYIPDVTISLGYTKRSNIDNRGDFVSAMVSFPLPFSSTKYANKKSAVFDKYSARKNLSNYILKRKQTAEDLKYEIQRIDKDLSIINLKTIKFAKNSRAITAKSYGLGNSSYVELLQSELKLQEILMLKSELLSKRDIYRVALKYTLGEKLSE